MSAIPTPHPHAELVNRWLEDTTQFVWCWSQPNESWSKAQARDLIDFPAGIFAIGAKPTAPPQRMCTLGGLQFPEPMREAPEYGVGYWFATHTSFESSRWIDSNTDQARLAAGLIHTSAAAAKAHSLALAAANRQAIEAAK